MQEAGVPPYNINDYECGTVTGFIITKNYYDLNIMHKNLRHLTPNDRKIVIKYNKNDKKRQYKGHLIFGRHWLKKDDIISYKKPVQNRIYLSPDDDLVIHLKAKIPIIITKYGKNYNLDFVMVSITLPHLLNLMNLSKNFEYRQKFQNLSSQNEKSLIKEMNSIKLQRKTSSENRYKITTKDVKKIKAHYIVHYVYKRQADLKLLIYNKARVRKDYNPLLDGEVLWILSHLKQFDVKADDILSAKPLSLSFRKYLKRFFIKNIHLKSFELLRNEYKPGIIESSS